MVFRKNRIFSDGWRGREKFSGPFTCVRFIVFHRRYVEGLADEIVVRRALGLGNGYQVCFQSSLKLERSRCLLLGQPHTTLESGSGQAIPKATLSLLGKNRRPPQSIIGPPACQGAWRRQSPSVARANRGLGTTTKHPRPTNENGEPQRVPHFLFFSPWLSPSAVPAARTARAV